MAHVYIHIAVLFESEKYPECINVCEEAVQVGREHRADYKIIARAFGRIGSAYLKLGDFDNAIKYFQKSLSEHRTADVLSKLKEAEKDKELAEKASYHDPALSDAAREEGNALFKVNDYAGAIAKYTEAIKRNETDPRAYSNRASCYTSKFNLV